jgi:hypothetical protein
LFILPEALMSDPIQAFSNHPPSNPNGRAEKDGFKASFYPGFVRRLAVRGADGAETELYRQSETFYLPPGFDKPWSSSTLEFTRPDGRRIVLQLEDPDQQIDRIEIHFKGNGTAGFVPIGGYSGDLSPSGDPPPPPPPGEVLICEDGVVLCPPICPEPEGPG